MWFSSQNRDLRVQICMLGITSRRLTCWHIYSPERIVGSKLYGVYGTPFVCVCVCVGGGLSSINCNFVWVKINFLYQIITGDNSWVILKHILKFRIPHLGGRADYWQNYIYDLRVISTEYLASFINRYSILHKNSYYFNRSLRQTLSLREFSSRSLHPKVNPLSYY